MHVAYTFVVANLADSTKTSRSRISTQGHLHSITPISDVHTLPTWEGSGIHIGQISSLGKMGLYSFSGPLAKTRAAVSGSVWANMISEFLFICMSLTRSWSQISPTVRKLLARGLVPRVTLIPSPSLVMFTPSRNGRQAESTSVKSRLSEK